jgi:hypothetical protein
VGGIGFVLNYKHSYLMDLVLTWSSAAGGAVNLVNERAGSVVTPLHVVAVYGSRETAELLIAKGADVNAKMEPESSTARFCRI